MLKYILLSCITNRNNFKKGLQMWLSDKTPLSSIPIPVAPPLTEQISEAYIQKCPNKQHINPKMKLHEFGWAK